MNLYVERSELEDEENSLDETNQGRERERRKTAWKLKMRVGRRVQEVPCGESWQESTRSALWRELAGEYKKCPVERGNSGLGEPLGCK